MAKWGVSWGPCSSVLSGLRVSKGDGYLNELSEQGGIGPRSLGGGSAPCCVSMWWAHDVVMVPRGCPETLHLTRPSNLWPESPGNGD